MYPIDGDYENLYDNLDDLFIGCEAAVDTLNLPVSYFLFHPDIEDSFWEDGDEPSVTIGFYMPRKGQTFTNVYRGDFDVDGVRAWARGFMRNSWDDLIDEGN